ncbi:hypothetical protein DM02DRAFT_47806 [Periconia macrospinosa]|uniref:Uncharacterized protein n=1 Tax=Periconia macrospinosa TaxID=97972 RepID=A0A2V1DMD5_9PLEO|nr:hypothetical protein DM02DRAFT_47806 [Periconia macrospinosa]
MLLRQTDRFVACKAKKTVNAEELLWRCVLIHQLCEGRFLHSYSLLWTCAPRLEVVCVGGFSGLPLIYFSPVMVSLCRELIIRWLLTRAKYLLPSDRGPAIG